MGRTIEEDYIYRVVAITESGQEYHRGHYATLAGAEKTFVDTDIVGPLSGTRYRIELQRCKIDWETVEKKGP